MLPLTTILKFEKVDRQNGTFMFGGDNSYAIDLFTKDFRYLSSSLISIVTKLSQPSQDVPKREN